MRSVSFHSSQKPEYFVGWSTAARQPIIERASRWPESFQAIRQARVGSYFQGSFCLAGRSVKFVGHGVQNSSPNRPIDFSRLRVMFFLQHRVGANTSGHHLELPRHLEHILDLLHWVHCHLMDTSPQLTYILRAMAESDPNKLPTPASCTAGMSSRLVYIVELCINIVHYYNVSTFSTERLTKTHLVPLLQ
jgi:hypothetical protein